jgi:ferrous iron transport protein A
MDQPGTLPQKALPLDAPRVGQRLRVVAIDGGDRLRRRLLALGLAVGGEVELVQRRGGGVVLAQGGNRVALGHGVAQQVRVEVIE